MKRLQQHQQQHHGGAAATACRSSQLPFLVALPLKGELLQLAGEDSHA